MESDRERRITLTVFGSEIHFRNNTRVDQPGFGDLTCAEFIAGK